MNLKSKVRGMLLSQGLLLERAAQPEGLVAFLKRFREHYVSVDLVRVGGDGDGGYLIPNVLDDVSYCFSPGVDYTAEFESEISRTHGIKSFMADASVESAPLQDENFVFDKKFLGNHDGGQLITLKSWLDDKVDRSDNSLILQMDIEGAEYDVLISESMETLKRFNCMVIEFHAVEKLFDRFFLAMFSSVFEKLFTEFSICHVHANNCCGVATLHGVDVPSVIEVTFLRNDYVRAMKNNDPVSLPHPLDRKNVEDTDDIQMPSIWWE